MLSDLFTSLSHALTGNFEIALAAALVWGVASILLSPCHLSSIPLIVGYLNKQDSVNLYASFRLSFVFSIGILIAITLIGLVTISLGRIIGDIGFWGNIMMAGLLVIIGLYLLEWIDLSWSAQPVTRLRGQPGAMVLGLIFGVGLGPCTFAYLAPVLGVVFSLAKTNVIKANLLVLAFGVGHVTVIVAGGMASNAVQRYLNWTSDSMAVSWIKRACGILVILGALYLLFITIR